MESNETKLWQKRTNRTNTVYTVHEYNEDQATWSPQKTVVISDGPERSFLYQSLKYCSLITPISLTLIL